MHSKGQVLHPALMIFYMKLIEGINENYTNEDFKHSALYNLLTVKTFPY